MENTEKQTGNSPSILVSVSIVAVLVAIISLLFNFIWWRDLAYLKEEMHTLSYKVEKAEHLLGIQEALRDVANPMKQRVAGSITSLGDTGMTLEVKVATMKENPQKGEVPFIESKKIVQVAIDKDTMFDPKREDFKKGDMVVVFPAEEVTPETTKVTARLVTQFVPQGAPEQQIAPKLAPPALTPETKR